MSPLGMYHLPQAVCMGLPCFLLPALLVAAPDERHAAVRRASVSHLGYAFEENVSSAFENLRITYKETVEPVEVPLFELSRKNGSSGDLGIPSDFSDRSDTPTVELEPFIVQEDRLPDLRSIHESRIDHFLRTSVIAEHVGKKVTVRLTFTADIRLGIGFSW